MLHAETIYWRGMVISNLLLLGVEPNTLTDNGRLGARGAPDSKGNFEANCEDALAGFAGTVSQSIPVRISKDFGPQ